MVQLAVQCEPTFSVDPLEVEREAPSYTIDTARTYRARYPHDPIFFLVGEDHLPALPTWNEFAELDRLVQFAILSRSDRLLDLTYPVIRRRFELSSTEIRYRVANGLSISYLVPEVVLQYIEQKNLYRREAYPRG